VATSEPGRLAKWAYSNKNLAGVALAVVGPVIGLAGVVNPLVGLALAPALYAVGALAAPGRKKVDLAGGIDPDDVRRSLAEVQRRIKGKVPGEVASRVARIAATINQCLPKADSLDGSSSQLYGMVRTATDYLPTALQTYLDLPRAYADRKVVTEGKTSLGLLLDQLELLARKMDEIADDLHRADTDKLVAHGRFLEEKFGKGDLDLPGH
jgi:hypothetical protein